LERALSSVDYCFCSWVTNPKLLETWSHNKTC